MLLLLVLSPPSRGIPRTSLLRWHVCCLFTATSNRCLFTATSNRPAAGEERGHGSLQAGPQAGAAGQDRDPGQGGLCFVWFNSLGFVMGGWLLLAG